MLRALLAAVVFTGLAACGGDDGTGPSIPSLSGVWNYSETQNDQVHSISCNNSGTVSITQSGSTFTGTTNQTGVCTGPGGSIDNSGSGTISGGQISGNNVSFQADFCQYQGSFSGNPPNSMSGTSSCTFQDAGETFNFTGTWQASR